MPRMEGSDSDSRGRSSSRSRSSRSSSRGGSRSRSKSRSGSSRSSTGTSRSRSPVSNSSRSSSSIGSRRSLSSSRLEDSDIEDKSLVRTNPEVGQTDNKALSPERDKEDVHNDQAEFGLSSILSKMADREVVAAAELSRYQLRGVEVLLPNFKYKPKHHTAGGFLMQDLAVSHPTFVKPQQSAAPDQLGGAGLVRDQAQQVDRPGPFEGQQGLNKVQETPDQLGGAGLVRGQEQSDAQQGDRPGPVGGQQGRLNKIQERNLRVMISRMNRRLVDEKYRLYKASLKFNGLSGVSKEQQQQQQPAVKKKQDVSSSSSSDYDSDDSILLKAQKVRKKSSASQKKASQTKSKDSSDCDIKESAATVSEIVLSEDELDNEKVEKEILVEMLSSLLGKDKSPKKGSTVARSSEKFFKSNESMKIKEEHEIKAEVADSDDRPADAVNEETVDSSLELVEPEASEGGGEASSALDARKDATAASPSANLTSSHDATETSVPAEVLNDIAKMEEDLNLEKSNQEKVETVANGNSSDSSFDIPNVSDSEVPIDDIMTPTLESSVNRRQTLGVLSQDTKLDASLLDTEHDLKLFREVLKLEVGDTTIQELNKSIDFTEFEDIVCKAIEKLETDAEAGGSLPPSEELRRQDEASLSEFNMRHCRVNVFNICKEETYKAEYEKALALYLKEKRDKKNLSNWDRKKKRDSLLTGLQKIKNIHLKGEHTPVASDAKAVRRPAGLTSTPRTSRVSSVDTDEGQSDRQLVKPTKQSEKAQAEDSVSKVLESNKSEQKSHQFASEKEGRPGKENKSVGRESKHHRSTDGDRVAKIKRPRTEERSAVKEKRSKEDKKREKYEKLINMKEILEEGLKKAPAVQTQKSLINSKALRFDERRKIEPIRSKKINLSKLNRNKSTTAPNVIDSILTSMQKEKKDKKTEEEARKELLAMHAKRLDNNFYVRKDSIAKRVDAGDEGKEDSEMQVDSTTVANKVQDEDAEKQDQGSSSAAAAAAELCEAAEATPADDDTVWDDGRTSSLGRHSPCLPELESDASDEGLGLPPPVFAKDEELVEDFVTFSHRVPVEETASDDDGDNYDNYDDPGPECDQQSDNELYFDDGEKTVNPLFSQNFSLPEPVPAHASQFSADGGGTADHWGKYSQPMSALFGGGGEPDSGTAANCDSFGGKPAAVAAGQQPVAVVCGVRRGGADDVEEGRSVEDNSPSEHGGDAGSEVGSACSAPKSILRKSERASTRSREQSPPLSRTPSPFLPGQYRHSYQSRRDDEKSVAESVDEIDKKLNEHIRSRRARREESKNRKEQRKKKKGHLKFSDVVQEKEDSGDENEAYDPEKLDWECVKKNSTETKKSDNKAEKDSEPVTNAESICPNNELGDKKEEKAANESSGEPEPAKGLVKNIAGSALGTFGTFFDHLIDSLKKIDKKKLPPGPDQDQKPSSSPGEPPASCGVPLPVPPPHEASQKPVPPPGGAAPPPVPPPGGAAPLPVPPPSGATPLPVPPPSGAAPLPVPPPGGATPQPVPPPGGVAPQPVPPPVCPGEEGSSSSTPVPPDELNSIPSPDHPPLPPDEGVPPPPPSESPQKPPPPPPSESPQKLPPLPPGDSTTRPPLPPSEPPPPLPASPPPPLPGINAPSTVMHRPPLPGQMPPRMPLFPHASQQHRPPLPNSLFPAYPPHVLPPGFLPFPGRMAGPPPLPPTQPPLPSKPQQAATPREDLEPGEIPASPVRSDLSSGPPGDSSFDSGKSFGEETQNNTINSAREKLKNLMQRKKHFNKDPDSSQNLNAEHERFLESFNVSSGKNRGAVAEKEEGKADFSKALQKLRRLKNPPSESAVKRGAPEHWEPTVEEKRLKPTPDNLAGPYPNPSVRGPGGYGPAFNQQRTDRPRVPPLMHQGFGMDRQWGRDSREREWEEDEYSGRESGTWAGQQASAGNQRPRYDSRLRDEWEEAEQNHRHNSSQWNGRANSLLQAPGGYPANQEEFGRKAANLVGSQFANRAGFGQRDMPAQQNMLNRQPFSEQMFLEKFAKDWKQLVDQKFMQVKKEINAELKAKSNKIQQEESNVPDIASLYHDPKLNTKIKRLNSDEVISLVEPVKKGDSYDFKCCACNLTIAGKKNLDNHLEGKKHRTCMANFTEVESSPEGVSSRSVASHLLSELRQIPLLGLEFVCEVMVGSSQVDYHCLLCDLGHSLHQLLPHLLSVRHRLTYLDKYFPRARKKFARVPNVRLWRQDTYNCLNLVSRQIESRFGRQEPAVVASPVVFDNTKSQLLSKVMAKEHARELADFTLESIPDPFEAYIHEIPHREVCF